MAGVRRSARLASREPSVEPQQQEQQPQGAGKYDLSPMRRARRLARFDVNAAVERRLAGDCDFLIYELTPFRRKAVTEGLTDRLEQVTEERDEARAEAAHKRSLRQAAARERIERQAKQRRTRQQKASQETDTPSKEPTPSSRHTSPPSQPEAEPEHQSEQEVEQDAGPGPEPEQELQSQPEQRQHHDESRAQTDEPEVTTQTSETAVTPALGDNSADADTSAETEATSTPPAATPAVPKWRKFFQNASNYLSPFKRSQSPAQTPVTETKVDETERKRSAPEDTSEQTTKRARTEERPRHAHFEEPATFAAQDTPVQKRTSISVPQTAPVAEKQAAKPAREARSATRRRRTPSVEPTQSDASVVQGYTSTPATQRRRTTSDNTNANHSVQNAEAVTSQTSGTELGGLTPASRKRSAPSDNNTGTPKPADRTGSTSKAKTPHTFTGPSSMNPKVPTSLSTIAEQSDSSRLGNSLFSEGTPLRMNTPSRMPHARRTVAEARRSRLSGGSSLGTPRLTTPRPGSSQSSTQQPYTWERGFSTAPRPSTAIRPADSNADRRYEKMERMRRLQRELEELKKDEDIIEMESHRRKRVKVDELQWIPHNRPGEGSDTFRVPDIDSDDEMEVDINVPLLENVFEKAQEAQEKRQPVREPSPVKKMASPVKKIASPVKKAASPVKKAQEPVKEVVNAPVSEFAFPSAGSEFTFPSVGKRAPGSILSRAEEESCRSEFASGLQAFMELYGY